MILGQRNTERKRLKRRGGLGLLSPRRWGLRWHPCSAPRRLGWTGLLVLLLAAPSFAQYTTVTATIKDPNGNIYASGSWQANLNYANVPAGSLVKFQGSTSFQTAYSGQLDSSGKFSISLPDNNIITPVGDTQYDFKFCQYYTTSAQSPSPACFNLTLLIHGASMDITSQAQAVSALLSPIAAGQVTGSLLPSVDNQWNLGSSTQHWSTAYLNTLSTTNISGNPSFTGSPTVTGNGTGGNVALPVIGGQVYNVKAYGAKGDGTTDDSSSIQTLINTLTGTDGSVCQSGSATIYFPPGTYKISSMLTYVGNSSCQIRFEGAAPYSIGSNGSVISWGGGATGPMLLCMGAWNTEFDHLTFDTKSTATAGIQLANATDDVAHITAAITTTGSQAVNVSSVANIAVGTWLPIDSGSNFEIVKVTAVGSGNITANFTKTHTNLTNFGGYSSSQVHFNDVSILSLTGASTDGVQIGNTGASAGAGGQTSEIYFDHFYAYGVSTTPDAGIKELEGGNVKNVWVKDSTFNSELYGASFQGYGSHVVDNSNFLNIKTEDVIQAAGNGGSLSLRANESEDTAGAAFVTDPGTSANQGVLTMIGNNWETQPTTSGEAGTVVNWSGPVVAIGNRFGISGNAAVAHLRIEEANSRVVSQDNFYVNAVAGSQNIANWPGNGGYAVDKLTSYGDVGGSAPGAAGTPLQNFSGKIVDPGGQVYNVKAYGAKGDGTTDDTTAIQSAINASTGRVLLPAGSYVISAPLVIDHRTDFVGVGQLSKLIPAAGFAGPFIKLGKDGSTPAGDKNQYGQLFNITLANFEIIDSAFRSQVTSGIWLFGVDQILVNNVQVWNLNGYALQLDNNGANDTSVRESLFKNFISWHSGNSASPCINIVSNSSGGDENNELRFIGGGVKNCYGTSVYINTNKTSSVGPRHIYFDNFQMEAREADDSVAGNPSTTAPNDPVMDIVHAKNVGISHSSISNAGQSSAALYLEGTSAEPVGTVTVTDSTVGGTTQASGTVNTSGTSVTWVSGSKFQTDGSWPTWNIVINSVNYAVSSVASATSLTLTTSAGTQTGINYSVTAGNYGIQTGYVSNLITKGINWLSEITGNENYAFVNGGNYYDLLPSGDGGYPLGKLVGFGSDAAFGIQNSNGGQAWVLDSLSNGNFSIFPKTDTTKQMRIGGVLADSSGNVRAAAKLLTLAAGTATWTFATAYTATPVCTLGPSITGNTYKVVPSTTNAVVTSSSGTDTATIGVICTPAAN